MSRIRLRQATKEDAPAMTAIMESLPEWFTPEAVDKVGAEDCRLPRLTAADEDGNLVGFVLWEQRSDEWEIAWIAVAKEHQRQGIGKMLMAAVVDRARQAGIACLRVATVAPTVEYEPYARQFLRDTMPWRDTMMRFAQLYKNLFVGKELSIAWSGEPQPLRLHLLVVVNGATKDIRPDGSGWTYEDEFGVFRQTTTFPQDRLHLLTWQEIRDWIVDLHSDDLSFVQDRLVHHPCLA